MNQTTPKINPPDLREREGRIVPVDVIVRAYIQYHWSHSLDSGHSLERVDDIHIRIIRI